MVLDADGAAGTSCSLFRDSAEVEPDEQSYKDVKDTLNNNYEQMPTPVFKQMLVDEWMPDPDDEHADTLAKVKSADEMSPGQKLMKKIRTYYPKILELTDSGPVLMLFMIMTLWALLAFDILYATTASPKLDKDFALVSLVFMVLFFIELCIRSITQPLYFAVEYSDNGCKGPGFFFVLDLLATVTMYQDVLPAFEDTRSKFANSANLEEDDSNIASARQSLETGTRVGRMLRLIRVVRVVKVISILGKRNKDKQTEELQPSAVGKRLNELIIQKVIITVGVITLLAPYLSMSDIDGSAQAVGLELLVWGKMGGGVDEHGGNYTKMVHDFGARMFNQSRSKLVFLEVEGARFIPQPGSGYDGCGTVAADPACLVASIGSCACPPDISDVRFSYLNLLTYNNSRAWFDQSENEKMSAVLSIVLTLFMASLLFVMFLLFSRDVTSMVVRPIESMIDIVRKLAQNPKLKLEGQSKSKYETEAVRIALAKIVGLMQLGFGGAGHEIISANLADSSGQELDLMRRGKKVECAYGFCDIRQFTDTVECLQDQVMLFTNSVGEIVHQACNDNRGEPNKNIGDAFLIVWKPKPSVSHTKVVDGALTAFRRTVREIASSQTLKLVTDVPAVHAKFGQDKYRTKIGFGLHFGWSVEGPVGSPTKIDCSYLSPEVKISDRLEAATKIYSSNILMSGAFYDLLSDHLKVGIRLIDHITMKAQNKPLRVYADDRSNLWLKVNPRLVEIYGAEAAYEQFSKMFHEGIDAFIKGDWATAWQKLEGASDFCPKDMPTKLLLKEMKKRSIDPVTPTAPPDWKGYHDSEV